MTARRIAAIRTSLLAGLAALVAGLLVAGLIVAGTLPASAAGGPRLSVGDVSIVEGDAGYTYLAFTVRLARATGRPVTVNYATSDVTAAAPADYGQARGEVSFRGTTVRKKVYVPVFGDTVLEPDETFKLTLSQPVGASLADRTGVGTIRDDEPATLSVVKAGSGSGTVTSDPPGIDCGSDCTEPYVKGTVVTLTAVPGSGSSFSGWSGGGCSGTGTCTASMTQATTVTATFTLQTHTLTVARAGNGSGTVTSNPVGISCGVDCTETYNHGTTVTLTASNAMGSNFMGWTGPCSVAGMTCTVTMTQATTVTATFVLQTHTLTVAKDGDGTGTVTSSPGGIFCGSDCVEAYNHGTSVTLTASSSPGSVFDGWAGAACSGTGPCTVSMTMARTVTATFSPI